MKRRRVDTKRREDEAGKCEAGREGGRNVKGVEEGREGGREKWRKAGVGKERRKKKRK